MARKQKAATNLLEIQNAAKTMFANIRFQSIDKQIKSVLLTSSVPDEGKTTAAWYLAQAAATAGHTVLIVECDMRRRSLARVLDLHPQNGLVTVLTGGANLGDAIMPTSVKGLFFLDAEPSVPNPADLLSSKRMANLNEQLTSQFDYVIYDTPPVGTFVDAAVLGRTIDAAILVVRPGRVKRQELLMANEQLLNAGVNVIGICTAFVESSGSEYYYSYYTKEHRKQDDETLFEKAVQNVDELQQPAEVQFGNDGSTSAKSASWAVGDTVDGRSVPRSGTANANLSVPSIPKHGQTKGTGRH